MAKGAFDAKSEMDQENPGVALKHDPTKGIQLPDADPNAAARRGDYAGVDMGNNPAAFIAEQQVRIERQLQGHLAYAQAQLFLMLRNRLP